MFHEEQSYVGIKLPQSKNANAIQMKVFMEHLSKDTRTVLPLDFLLHVSSDGAASSFPWKNFEPPAEWKKHPDPTYTYFLSSKNIASTAHAFYHARRGIKHKEWNTVVIPFADFACAYGTGSMTATYLEQKVINPENLLTLMFAPPHYPLGFAKTRMKIDDIALVRVPGTDEQLRSYWQMPRSDRAKVKFIADPSLPERGGVVKQVLNRDP